MVRSVFNLNQEATLNAGPDMYERVRHYIHETLVERIRSREITCLN